MTMVDVDHAEPLGPKQQPIRAVRSSVQAPTFGGRYRGPVLIGYCKLRHPWQAPGTDST
jgi:hypothetical protein